MKNNPIKNSLILLSILRVISLCCDLLLIKFMYGGIYLNSIDFQKTILLFIIEVVLIYLIYTRHKWALACSIVSITSVLTYINYLNYVTTFNNQMLVLLAITTQTIVFILILYLAFSSRFKDYYIKK